MLKTVSKEVKKYIPQCEKNSPNPTTICYKSLSKKDYDEYMESLTEIKRNKIVSHAGKSGEFLFRKCLAQDSNEVFIYNGTIDGKDNPEIKDKEQAVKFLLGLENVDAANEIENVMRGQSSLNEEEIKN